MKEIKFRWVGINVKFGGVCFNQDLTINKIIKGDVLSFFNHSNRGKGGNCDFLSEDLFVGIDKNKEELYEGDIVNIGGLNEVIKYIDNILCCFSPKIHGDIDTLKVEQYEDYIVYSSDYFELYEKIGNIYENSDLLS